MTMTLPTSVPDRRGSQAPRPVAARSVRVAALAVAIVLVAMLGIALFLRWLPGDAPDLYSRMNADVSRPSGPIDGGTGSAWGPMLAIQPAR
jgi:hypothetical protein